MAVISARYAYLNAVEISWFKLANVDIECPGHLDNKIVLEKSELKIGESIYDQDYDKAVNSLISLPGIEAVSVKRKLPSTIKLELHPDEVVLFVKTDKIYGLTRGLKMINVNKRDQVLPVVTGLSSRKRDSYRSRMRLCYALSLYNELRKQSLNLSNRLSEIHFNNNEEVEMFFDPGGVKVQLPLRNFEKTLARLVVMDNKGILRNSGSFDMTAGKMVVKGGV